MHNLARFPPNLDVSHSPIHPTSAATMKFVIFGGGGHVARHFARAASKAGHSVISVVRNNDHVADLKELGAEPAILSLEDASREDLTALLKSHHPDATIFAAGAGGKGGRERTRAVDYEGALKVYAACEAAGALRFLLVSAIDTRDRSKPVPEWYTQRSREGSDRVWGSIGPYMQAKYDSERELHCTRLEFTVLRPGLLTHEPAGNVEVGRTQMGSVSRASVAEVLLACALEPKTAGLTLDVMDGDDTVHEAVAQCVRNRTDAWTG